MLWKLKLNRPMSPVPGPNYESRQDTLSEQTPQDLDCLVLAFCLIFFKAIIYWFVCKNYQYNENM